VRFLSTVALVEHYLDEDTLKTPRQDFVLRALHLEAALMSEFISTRCVVLRNA